MDVRHVWYVAIAVLRVLERATIDPWAGTEYLPVAFPRSSWPGLQNFTTWVIL